MSHETISSDVYEVCCALEAATRPRRRYVSDEIRGITKTMLFRRDDGGGDIVIPWDEVSRIRFRKNRLEDVRTLIVYGKNRQRIEIPVSFRNDCRSFLNALAEEARNRGLDVSAIDILRQELAPWRLSRTPLKKTVLQELENVTALALPMLASGLACAPVIVVYRDVWNTNPPPENVLMIFCVYSLLVVAFFFGGLCLGAWLFDRIRHRLKTGQDAERKRRFEQVEQSLDPTIWDAFREIRRRERSLQFAARLENLRRLAAERRRYKKTPRHLDRSAMWAVCYGEMLEILLTFACLCAGCLIFFLVCIVGGEESPPDPVRATIGMSAVLIFAMLAVTGLLFFEFRRNLRLLQFGVPRIGKVLFSFSNFTRVRIRENGSWSRRQVRADAPTEGSFLLIFAGKKPHDSTSVSGTVALPLPKGLVYDDIENVFRGPPFRFSRTHCVIAGFLLLELVLLGILLPMKLS